MSHSRQSVLTSRIQNRMVRLARGPARPNLGRVPPSHESPRHKFRGFSGRWFFCPPHIHEQAPQYHSPTAACSAPPKCKRKHMGSPTSLPLSLPLRPNGKRRDDDANQCGCQKNIVPFSGPILARSIDLFSYPVLIRVPTLTLLLLYDQVGY